MAELLSKEPPFTYCGIDMFGLILVKEGCKEVKRYGCPFKIHIESTNALSTDVLIQAL